MDGAVEPFQGLHLVLPRSDYEIVEGSWEVAGLKGTGSKDVIVRDAFVPDYRVLRFAKVVDGTAPGAGIEAVVAAALSRSP